VGKLRLRFGGVRGVIHDSLRDLPHGSLAPNVPRTSVMIHDPIATTLLQNY